MEKESFPGMYDTSSAGHMKPFEELSEKETEDILDETERRLCGRLYIDETWIVDYVRIRMRARKIEK